jgi:TldD protein
MILSAQQDNGTIIFQAMHDELQRSIQELKIENQVKPYYIAYRIIDKENVEISGSYGSLMYSDNNRTRTLFVDVRVGDHTLDNSNFVCQTRSSRIIGSENTSLPIDDNYDALRYDIWLTTDGTYKTALEVLARKQATLQNQQVKEDIADFAAAPLSDIIEPIAHLALDPTHWELTVMKLSEVFKRFPRIQESAVTFQSSASNVYFLDSEKHRTRRADLSCYIEVTAQSQTTEGYPIERTIGFYGQKPEDFPEVSVLEQRVAAMAETLSLETELKREDDYSGPVLFTGQAAAELIFQILGKGVSDVKTPLFENEMLARAMGNKNMGMLVSRYGRRVMPDFLSAIDDPTLTQYRGIGLTGHFVVDDQGINAEPVELVTEGKLTGLLMSRAPTKKLKESNGHGRYRTEQYGSHYIGLVSNLIIKSTEQKTPDELKAMLIELCKEYDIPYGIVITRLEPTRELTLRDRYLLYYASMTGGVEQTLLSSPAVAYKISVDGERCELIRGLDFSAVTTRVLRDICATGDADFVYNSLFRDDQGNQYPISIVTPSILVEEMELIADDTKPRKLPIVKHPFYVE